MSEQPPLYHQNVINAAAGPRINDPQMMPVSYYQTSAGRLDGMSLHPSATVPMPNASYYPFFVRPSEQMNLVYRMPPVPLICPTSVLPRPFPETALPNQVTNSVDYSTMAFPSQPYSTHVYPPTAHSTQPLPTSAASVQRTVPPSTQIAPVYRPTKAREKRILLVKDPETGASIDLTSQPKPPTSPFVPTDERPPSAVPDETSNHPTNEHGIIHVSNAQDVIEATQNGPLPDHDVPISDSAKTEEPTASLNLEDNLVENGESHDASVSKTVIDDFIKEESAGESEDSEVEDAICRRVYSRDFLLTCKDSPIARVPLQELAAYYVDYSRPRKGQRGANRAAQQRTIRLPTGITVKRVEGAFVPSHLRKKDGAGENDRQKILSRELNVILNRVSDGNLSETVSDIRKLDISTLEDLQLLSKLVFQKSIRQPKYSKVFASLCKEMKGFEVSGSEPFENLLLQQARELFHTPLETLISELNAALDAKIAAAQDEAVKRVLEDGRETNIVKKTEAYYGNITFLAELFLCRLVPARTMTKCLNELKDSSTPEALTSMLILLRACGQELDQQSKNAVDLCFSRLNLHLKSNKLPTHQVFKIQELIDLRERGWKELDRAHNSQLDAPSKRPDDKVRWSCVQPSVEPKRKPAQSINPLTPSSLAVTQQSSDSRKLGPAHANWSQGSGLLSKNSEDRDGGPRAPTGHSSAIRQPGRSFAQSLNSKEDFDSVVKRKAGSARTVLTMLKANEDNMYPVFEDCKPDERSAIFFGVLESLMDEKSQVRNAAGIMCLQLLNKKLLNPSDLISTCERYLSNCTEYWLEDYPHGWRYLAEIFQHLIQKDQDYFSVLLSILKFLKSEGRGATVLAHCLYLSSLRLGADCVGAKFRNLRLEWSKLGISPSEVENFANQYSVSFTLSSNPWDVKLRELNDLAVSNVTSLDELTNFFKNLCKPDLPNGFVRSCTRTLISKSKDPSRSQVHNRAIGLGILVDHNPDRELEVLQALDDCANNGFTTDTWQKALLDKKVISTDALESWSKSSSSRESVPEHFPVRNK